MIGIASAAIYSILTPIADDTGLTLGDLVSRDEQWQFFRELIIMTECWNWLHVPILRLGLLGLATTRSPIWEAPNIFV